MIAFKVRVRNSEDKKDGKYVSKVTFINLITRDQIQRIQRSSEIRPRLCMYNTK